MSAPFPFLIVPGFTPPVGAERGLHPIARERLRRAIEELRLGVAERVIVSGAAVRGGDCEADQMRDWLYAHGVDEARVLVDREARNTTTNLRNAGRIVLAHGATQALVVTNLLQDYYLGFPWRSSFHLRCLAEFGYLVGQLAWLRPMCVSFRPARAITGSSWVRWRG